MYQLLTDQPLERLQVIYEALPDELRTALNAPIAKALNARPSSLARRDLAFKMKGLRAFLVKQRDEALAADILRSYLLGPRKQLVTDFLDGTGVAHEDGQVEDDDATPAADKIGATVEGLLAAHDARDVALYLAIAVTQWPEIPELAEALERNSPGA